MIETLIKNVVSNMIKVINFEAEVVSVDQENDTCVVLPVDGAEIPDVKLKSILSDAQSKFIVYPKVGSFVTVSILQNMESECYVSQYSEIEKVVLNTDAIIINEGEHGGIVNWPDAKEQLDKVKDLLEAIVNVLTGSPVMEPGNGSPSALQTALNTALAGKALPDFENLEDTKITH